MEGLTTELREKFPVRMKAQAVDKSGFEPLGGTKTKFCPSCGRELPIDSFARHGKSKDGYTHECRECHRRHKATAPSKGNPLEKFTARELMHELSMRGYKGEITFTEVKVHKMNLKDF